MNYELAYRLGFHPWEDAEEQASFTEKIAELFEREESGREPPYGPALDLGTGSGVWGIRLAKRGWQVTGVDLVDKALQRARERVQSAGVDMRLVHGDVTALQEAGVGSDFQLVQRDRSGLSRLDRGRHGGNGFPGAETARTAGQA